MTFEDAIALIDSRDRRPLEDDWELAEAASVVADAKRTLVRRCNDAELLLNAITQGVARWEWFAAKTAGEVCVDGLRHCCEVVDGSIVLTVRSRLALRKVTAEWLVAR